MGVRGFCQKLTQANEHSYPSSIPNRRSRSSATGENQSIMDTAMSVNAPEVVALQSLSESLLGSEHELEDGDGPL
jgi:hypothetical protein